MQILNDSVQDKICPKRVPAAGPRTLVDDPPRPITATAGASPDNSVKPSVFIVVVGATGSGKTSFVNLASGSSLRVGKGLESCTNEVQTTLPFELGGKMVTLIDTPGYDDTGMSDTDILKMLALYLASLYERKESIVGVIYVHRISDFKMGGISMRNLTMFRHLCGESALANVAIVTNMWGQVSKETGEAREAELANKDKFFKPLLERSARLLRHDNTLSSAQAIVDSLVHNPPRPLRIQKELVDEGKDVSQTAAGEELNRELAEQAKRNLQELEAVQKEMEEAIRENDGETRKELEIEQRKLQMEISRVQSESRNLATGFLRRKEEAKQESVRVAMERERELRELQLLITQNESLAAVEEDAIARQSREVSAQRLPCEQNATRSQRVPEAPVPYPTPVPRQRHHHSQTSCDGTVRGPILPSPENAELRQMLSAVQRQYDEPPPRTDGPLTMLFNFVLPRDGSKTAQSRYPEDDYATAAPSSKGSKGGGGRGKQRHAHGGPDDSHGSTS